MNRLNGDAAGELAKDPLQLLGSNGNTARSGGIALERNAMCPHVGLLALISLILQSLVMCGIHAAAKHSVQVGALQRLKNPAKNNYIRTVVDRKIHK